MNPIRFNEPFLTGKELDYIEDVFAQNQFYGNGKYTKLCTNLIKARLAAENVLLTDSCTSALEIVALLLRNFEIQQEVIVPSYTFSSTASAFARAGFKIVFAEVHSDTMMLNLEDVRSKITENTVAVAIVHYGGYCADIEEAVALCKEKDVFLVEDAAQAFACKYKGASLGTIGDFGCFSFHETKNIHAGLSGALVVKDAKMMRRASHIWERGTNRQDVLKGLANKYSWVEIGGSFYPTELQAAFLLAQLEAIDKNIAERRDIYMQYYQGLSDLRKKGLINHPSFDVDFESNFHAFFVIFNSEAEADKVRESLVAEGVNAYIGYIPLHSSPVGLRLGYKPESLPITEEYASRLLRLPFHNNMIPQEAADITDLIKGVLCEQTI